MSTFLEINYLTCLNFQKYKFSFRDIFFIEIQKFRRFENCTFWKAISNHRTYRLKKSDHKSSFSCGGLRNRRTTWSFWNGFQLYFVSDVPMRSWFRTGSRLWDSVYCLGNYGAHGLGKHWFLLMVFQCCLHTFVVVYSPAISRISYALASGASCYQGTTLMPDCKSDSYWTGRCIGGWCCLKCIL